MLKIQNTVLFLFGFLFCLNTFLVSLFLLQKKYFRHTLRLFCNSYPGGNFMFDKNKDISISFLTLSMERGGVNILLP